MEAAQASWQWVNDIPSELVFVIGIIEIIGAIGLILPQAIKVYPQLLILAVLGLSVVALSSRIFHIIRGEFVDIIVNIIFLTLCLIVTISQLLFAAEKIKSKRR
ncbi:DoxX family protein [Bacillus sp. A301a_S52]|nr:DoxX family protein [Bacillus sp. A301a_S52]